jgi:uncharacterized lipoprotein YddW (UPF0748 family)
MKRMMLLAAMAWMPAHATDRPWVRADPGGVELPEIRREFRGAWVATVANIDWPSRKDLSTAQQKEEAVAMLDALRRAGFNAVIFQARPSCDAVYRSSIEPWSEFLTGESGKAPAPEYDPLSFWIAESHARGMELHVWVNPFRARHIKAEKPDAASHISRTRPDLVRKYDGYLWLDPGEGEAQDHAMRVILDLVSRYDLDGLHIDDYFYPYPKAGEAFPDDASFARYRRAPGSTMSREDWRRANIDRFVERMYREIKASKPHVKVGISPFGIWRPEHPAGVKGMDAFEKLHADARKWLREGWLDYVAPQLYWKIDAPQQPYGPLLDWWIGENAKGRAVWPGNFTSRLLPEAKSGWEASEIAAQVEETRKREGAGGNIHFSAKAITGNAGGVTELLTKGVYEEPALSPAMEWIDATPPATPVVRVSGDAEVFVEFEPGSAESSRVWVVAVRSGSASGGQWTLRVAPGSERRVRASSEPGAIDAAAVWAVDRSGNLSEPAVWTR